MKALHAVKAYDLLKRFSDVAVAATGLVLMAPLLLLAAVLIKLTSAGPILYRARRAGLRGEPFDVLKLRTMVQDADRQGVITVGADPRVTSLGRCLRRTKLDEVPQLWNILRGEMSLVGPRPESLSIVEEHFTPQYLEALSIRPGLTCTGTVYYYVYQEHLQPPAGMGPEEFYVRYLLDAKMSADLHYVHHRGWLYDVRLLWQTAWVMGLKVSGIAPRWQPPIPLPATGGPAKAPGSGDG